uniref:Uncharacterized protein n=1 Tax=viral metagenome TaxID=1070528 RepID=A0A6C0KW02_9ZZZZ
MEINLSDEEKTIGKANNNRPYSVRPKQRKEKKTMLQLLEEGTRFNSNIMVKGIKPKTYKQKYTESQYKSLSKYAPKSSSTRSKTPSDDFIIGEYYSHHSQGKGNRKKSRKIKNKRHSKNKTRRFKNKK